MTRLLSISKSQPRVAHPVANTGLELQGWTEPQHLEPWLVDNLEILDDTLLVISTQFSRWESDIASAKERLDILALSTSGELVVIEPKRGSDTRIHLQALTYAALVSGFTQRTLVDEYARWRSAQTGEVVTDSEAEQLLRDHVETTWEDVELSIPRIILVAERFPEQVITTLWWLEQAAEQISIEAHEYTLFDRGDEVAVAFQRLWPVEDLSGRVLRPGALQHGASAARERVSENRRRARSAAIIHENRAIRDGGLMTLELSSLVKADVVDRVNEWLDEDPLRKQVTWHSHQSKPLRWAYSVDPHAAWTPTGLRDDIFEAAGVGKGSFSAADAWCFEGRSLYWIANDYSA